MAASWQDAATQQAELLAARLKELLSSGLGYLNSEFGVDLGLKPDLYPPWVILSTACMGLLVIVVVWAFVCRGLFRGKVKSKTTVETIAETVKPTVKSTKPEDQKKKNKKKPSEKVVNVSLPKTSLTWSSDISHIIQELVESSLLVEELQSTRKVMLAL